MHFGRWTRFAEKPIQTGLRTLFAALAIFGHAVFAQDPLAEPGFQHFYNLEYDQALAAFQKKAAAAPNDPSPQNHIAQTVLYHAMFLHGALESDLISATNPFTARPKLPVTEQQKNLFEGAIARAIQLSQSRIDRDPNDTRALYAMGVAVGLRANWNYLVHKAWIDPLRDATSARKLHNRATEIDPGFHDARLVQGVHDYLIGSLPLAIKMMGFLAGFRGDREEGIRTLYGVVQKGSTNRADAAVLLSAILRREKRQSQAVPLLEDITNRFPRNHLFRFELAMLYADLGDRTRALAQIDRIEQQPKRLVSASRVDYMRGHLLFLLRDYDAAIPNLERAAAASASAAGEVHARAQAWLRLGQALDLKGRRKEAMQAYRQALQTGPETSYAKEAKDYLSSPFKQRHA